jgi:hypothetical protein
VSDQLNPQLEFFYEQLYAQYRDLKTDFKTEISSLRQDLEKEFKHTDGQLLTLKVETDSRLKLMEERILSIQKIVWMGVGITSFIVVTLEVLSNRV